MGDTKERIMLTALRLFAADGYEAVSVSDIAGALGMTKGALYRHYRNKRDIFESILKRMEQRDAEQAKEHKLPEGTAIEMEEVYRSAGVDEIISFSEAMFRYWTMDEFASQFRKMLTLEQFRGFEMGKLYQKYLASGPLGYLTDLFRCMELRDPEQEAVNLYAPMFLLYSCYDAAEEPRTVLATMDEILKNVRNHLKDEMEKKK